jgi:hypothetical protein
MRQQARVCSFSVALVLVAAAAISFVAAASARQLESGQIDEVLTEEEESFCGVDGLTVEFVTHTVGRFHVVSHGHNQLPYFGANLKITQVVTNVDNGNSVMSIGTTRDKDQRVTDNGDRTFTILVLATGNAVLYGPDGKAIARNPGQIRFEILIDNGGTPTDPDDDKFLRFLRDVKGSTGRSDDFCEAAVPILLG